MKKYVYPVGLIVILPVLMKGSGFQLDMTKIIPQFQAPLWERMMGAGMRLVICVSQICEEVCSIDFKLSIRW